MGYRVVRNEDELAKMLRESVSMPEPNGLLMVHPEFFDVVDVKNPYMEDSIGQVDVSKAVEEWENVQQVFLELKDKEAIARVEVVDGVEDLEDMVFCANPILVWQNTSGEPFVLLSNMQYDRRQAEVKAFEQYFLKKNTPIQKVSERYKLEGNGDLIPHPGKRCLWMGYGYRTDVEVADEVVKKLEAHIIPLKLVSEHFYHLDTCFCVVDEKNVVICKEAFDEEGLKLINAGFEHVHTISLEEAKNGFALNALVMRNQNGQKFGVLPKNNPEMKRILENLDVNIFEVDTTEFIKSGGSVYCMKTFLY